MAGAYTRYVVVIDAVNGDYCISPTANINISSTLPSVTEAVAPSEPSCELTVNYTTSTTFVVGGSSELYTLTCNVANLQAYWHGTKNGVVDTTPSGVQATYFPSGPVLSAAGAVNIVYPAFTTNQVANAPGYIRWIELRDSNGNSVTNTNSVLVVVDPN